MKKLSFIFAALLAGCNGGSGGGISLPPLPDQAPTTTDAFFTQVAQLVVAVPDDTEPASIDSLAATAPESSESATL